MIISVIGPSRGRPDRLIKGIKNLAIQAEDLNKVEFIFRFDDDDLQSAEKVKKYFSSEEYKNINLTILIGKRHKYLFLNKYWDECTSKSKGEYLMTWTDDYEIDIHQDHKGWDSLIRQAQNQFYILVKVI